jgi:PAS domain S-box-containing protein
LRKDGSRFWTYVIIDPIRDRSGKLLGYAKVTRDLTERRAAEAELRKSQKQFQLLVQGVTDYAIYLLTPQGNVSSWNSGAERIKGYKPEQIIGRHFSTFYTEEDRKAGLPEIALETARAEGRFEREGIRIRKDGTQFWANVVVDAIKDTEGSLIGFAKITRDITERKKAEEELERTREALIQSQKMEAIGHLTGGVAHDFNNLLMAIQGSLELLKRRIPADPQLTQFLDNALQGAQRAAALTQRMLAVARRQGAEPPGCRHHGPGTRHDGFAAKLSRPVRPDRNPLSARPAEDNGRREPAGAGAAQSCNERQRGDAKRRLHCHFRARAVRNEGAGHQAGPLCVRLRHGHGNRHGRRNPYARHRAVLHDQRRRQGNRAGAAHGARHDGAVRREAGP